MMKFQGATSHQKKQSKQKSHAAFLNNHMRQSETFKHSSIKTVGYLKQKSKQMKRGYSRRKQREEEVSMWDLGEKEAVRKPWFLLSPI